MTTNPPGRAVEALRAYAARGRVAPPEDTEPGKEAALAALKDRVRLGSTDARVVRTKFLDLLAQRRAAQTPNPDPNPDPREAA